jgi:chemotaxis protein histidine kinase CheA
VYDQIKTQLDTIAELGDEQVAELQADIVSQFEMVEGEDPTPETVDAMTSLADSLDIVRGELSRREAQAAELAAKAAEAVARVKGEADDAGEEMAMTEDEPMEEEITSEETPAEETPAEETPAPEAEVEVEADEEDKEDEDEAMKASAEVSEETPELITDAPVEAEASAVESETVVETVEPAAELSEATEEVAEAVVESEDSAELATSEETVAEASTNQEDGSELSTENETPAETAELATEVAEGSEASVVENIESPIALEEEQEEQAPVTAAAEQPFEAPADRQPVVQVTEAPVAITAGADIPGYTAGSTINDMYEVAQAMEKRIHSLRRVNGGDGEQHIVASVTTSFPEERILTTDAESNSLKINTVSSQALVASGGHAAPLEVKYDIYAIGSTTNRPVRDSLPRFQADRGGIRFVTPPSFAAGSYANAVGVWTAAVDANPESATKTSLTVAAASELTATTDAVTLQLQFGNLMTRAYPELIARHNELALVQHAREAEQYVLGKIADGSTAVTSGTLIGFGRDFLVSVRKAAVAYRSRHRIAQSTTLKAIVPDWVYDAMAADLALNMPGDGNLSVSRSEIEGYLGQLNVSLVASPDMTVYGSQGAAALLEFPDSFDWYLFAEGTFLFLDGGSLDLGIIRDSSLVGTNDYKMFVETFEGVAKVGIESLKITQTVNVNGVAAALRDTTGGATAAAIEA